MDNEILSHLIDIEKQAASLLSDSETEAEKKLATAKFAAEEEKKKIYNEIVAEQEAQFEAQKKIIDEKKQHAYDKIHSDLTSLKRDTAAFTAFLDSYFLG
ncbi:hypothetical protein DWQ65_05940 [Treponema phagedenis]|uniref:ATPase n=1 Tax=Treponema phagedenis TaxID=162 RepID=A0A0B7GTE2_TREPH|nr:hypothetical protein [Treponema phagedenis]EFW38528.1 hypothetical protein HMPREF9554_00980 [Treponema phagedenis F0421]NVP24572.1 hypothetical protein [Treponema phagedenis]QEJ94731.1 hypothetical protein FUT79_05595 [Treponema phagedenis]QEJ97667.1 hypothetical protein FUT82_06450 [Treponema phagedenis]QEK00636.1 hypothetical protein FUT84_05285 [Treponema phagedenis]